MIAKTPSYWFQKPGVISYGLTPASFLYGIGRKAHIAMTREHKVNIPVICIGNLIAGGSGKTPIVRAIFELIKTHNLATNPVILTRGYGGDHGQAPYHLDHNAKITAGMSDEAALLSCTGPVIMAADRYQGALHAETLGYDLIIMDDGFQNPGLYKDISILVIDGTYGFGNQKLLPAGPLREPVHDGMKRAQACIIIGEDSYGVANILPSQMPCFHAHIETDFSPDPTQSYIGFCGLAHPDKFKRTLTQQHISLTDFIAYPDHYPYSQDDITTLIKMADQHKSRLLTTEKDAMRLISFNANLESYLDILPIHIKWDSDIEKLIQLLPNKAGEKA